MTALPDAGTANPVQRQVADILAGWERDGFGRYGLQWRDGALEVVSYGSGEVIADDDDLGGILSLLEEIDQGVRADAAARAAAFSSASPTKSRGRPKDPAVARRRDRLVELAEQSQPATVRHLYYIAETEGLVVKSEKGCRRVQNDLLLLRRGKRVPYDWISDNTRWMRKSSSYRGIDHFLNLTLKTYRRALWADMPVRVEIWCEKDALAGVIMEETDPYDVPLLVARGCSSETYLYETAQAIAAHDKPTYIYHFGDRDPTGLVAAAHIERTLRHFAPGAEIHFERAAVTEAQIAEWKLPTRPTKRKGNRHAKGFVGDSCELEAIPPLKLREIVRAKIEQHIDVEQFRVVKAAEESEREALTMFARSWRAQA